MEDGGWTAWATMVLANLKSYENQILELRQTNTQMWEAMDTLKREICRLNDCQVQKDHLLEMDVNTLKIEAREEGKKAGQDVSVWISIVISGAICILDWLVTNWPSLH